MPTAQSLTPYQRHKQRWQSCTLCPLCKTRKQVVIGKGSLPADVLWISEAPGASEDVIGRPLVGPAGILLDQLIATALRDSGKSGLKFCFTNTIGCIPKENSGSGKRKGVEPLPNELAACRPRWIEFIALAKPKVIVAVGKVAYKELTSHKSSYTGKVWEITHPSALLQQPIHSRGLDIQRTIVILTEIFESL